MASNDQPLTDIDPATGTFWKTDRPEYWLVAARGWREAPASSERSRARNERYAASCEARAAALAEQVA